MNNFFILKKQIIFEKNLIKRQKVSINNLSVASFARLQFEDGSKGQIRC